MVVKEVPPNSTVVGIPGRVVIKDGKRVDSIHGVDASQLPDPVAQAIKCILDRMHEMEKDLNNIKSGNPVEELTTEELDGKATTSCPVLRQFIDGAGI